MHPYPIHYSEKSGYFTSVDDNTQPTGKRKIRRKTEESLWEKLAEWYIDKYSLNITFKELAETCLENVMCKIMRALINVLWLHGMHII